MDVNALTKLLDYGLLGLLLALALYAIIYLHKKVLEIEEKRIADSADNNKTVTIALNSVTQHMENVDTALESVGSTMKAIMITLEKKNDKI